MQNFTKEINKELSVKFSLPKKISDAPNRKKDIQKVVNLASDLIRQQITQMQLIPKDTGLLERNVLYKYGSAKDTSEIIWQVPYAKKLYYGEGFKFSTRSYANAQAKWDEPITKNRDKMNKITQVSVNQIFKKKNT
jgi:hypothetical protein